MGLSGYAKIFALESRNFTRVSGYLENDMLPIASKLWLQAKKTEIHKLYFN